MESLCKRKKTKEKGIVKDEEEVGIVASSTMGLGEYCKRRVKIGFSNMHMEWESGI